MGARCSQPVAPPAHEILVLAQQITMVSAHSSREMRMLRRMLTRNISILKKRIETYEEKLKDADETNPATTVWRAEKERAEELIKKLRQMQLPLAYMA
jgi:hypothetical protein